MSAPPSSSSSSSSKVRPLPVGISIQLPPVKRPRSQPSEEEEEETNQIEPDVQIAHNTPSPAFFAAATTPIVNQRCTTNPCNPLPPFLTRVRHAKQLVIITSDPKHNVRPYKVLKDMDVIEVIEDGGMVIGHDGMIVAVGTDAEIAAKYDAPPSSAASTPQTPVGTPLASPYAYQYEIDASGTCILPGLVDGHTHPVWAGDRVHEFKLKLAGATYMDIHKAGGGIGFTVEHTRKATEAELLESLLGRLDRALRQGTTLLEAKSGYGLELETELKMLKVIQSADEMHPIDLVRHQNTSRTGVHQHRRRDACADSLLPPLTSFFCLRVLLGWQLLRRPFRS